MVYNIPFLSLKNSGDEMNKHLEFYYTSEGVQFRAPRPVCLLLATLVLLLLLLLGCTIESRVTPSVQNCRCL
uniref:Uncharacterized protein n=1 Tax=Oryza brachyantha TaxID=4533 RepID=J3L748_ORYBR